MLKDAIKSRLKIVWELGRGTVMEWAEDKATSLGAALAYYSLFSLGPLLIIAISVAGWVFGSAAASGQVYSYLHNFLGDTTAQTVQSLIVGFNRPRSGLLGPVISIGTLIFAAISVVVQLRISLNAIWGVRPKADRAVYAVVRQYLVSLVAVFGLAIILMASILASAALAVVSKFMIDVLPVSTSVLRLANFVVSFSLLSLAFAVMFKYLSDIRIPWRDIWPGALGTAFLFAIGKDLIGFYLGSLQLTTSYGAAASVVAILIWVYYLSQVLLIGAEFIKVYSRWRGTKAKLVDGAMQSDSPGPFGITPGPTAAAKLVGGGRNQRADATPARTPRQPVLK